MCEKTYRRHFNEGLGLERLNQLLIEQQTGSESRLILAVDCTFNAKSGKQTAGLDWFYNGRNQRSEKGLEWSTIAVVDVEKNTAYALSAQQTEAGLSQTKAQEHGRAEQRNRVDFYLGHLAYSQTYFPPGIKHVVGDAFYSKKKWVKGLRGLDLHCVGKLRRDANLKFFYHGKQKPRGRKRLYDGKVDLSDTARLHLCKTLKDGTKILTADVWAVTFQQPIRLVYLLQENAAQRRYALLFSTDVNLCAEDIYTFYKARFQIEFIFRDARQFTGFAHAQARNLEALDSHANASLTAVNLARVAFSSTEKEPLSLASCKRFAFNEHLLERIISIFDLDQNLIKSSPHYPKLLSYGSLSP